MSEKMMNISPDLQASILCDDVRQERNGKFLLIGIFEHLVVGGDLPTHAPRFALFNRWCAGSGTYEQQTRILGPDGLTKIIEGRPIEIKLENETSTATTVEIFVGLKITLPGVYWVEIYLDHALKVRYPFSIEHRKNPK